MPATPPPRLVDSKVLVWNWEIFRRSGLCDTLPGPAYNSLDNFGPADSH